MKKTTPKNGDPLVTELIRMLGRRGISCGSGSEIAKLRRRKAGPRVATN